MGKISDERQRESLLLGKPPERKRLDKVIRLQGGRIFLGGGVAGGEDSFPPFR